MALRGIVPLAARALRGAVRVLSVGLALSVASRAAADEPAVLRVVMPSCDAAAFDVDLFGKLITLELHSDGVERVDLVVERPAMDAASPGAVATITLGASPCTAEAREIDVVIVDELTRKTVERRLTVVDLAPGARPRVIALSVAELLRASWSELRMPDAPKGFPVPTAVRLASMDLEHRRSAPVLVPPLPPPSTPPPSPMWHAGAALEARFFPTYGSTVLGPDVVLSIGSADRVPLRLRLDAEALFGTSYDPLGSISVKLVAFGAAVVLAHHTGPIDVEVGPRLEIGWGAASGNAASTTTISGSGSTAIVDASAVLALRVALFDAYWASFASDFGGVLHGLDAQADARKAAGFGGPIAGAAIGLGRTF